MVNVSRQSTIKMVWAVTYYHGRKIIAPVMVRVRADGFKRL